MKKIFLITLFFPLLSLGQVPYFQQEVNYHIRVRLNDRDNSLSAYERLEYINHSPDTLRYLWFHLWPNAYANNHTALARQLLNSTQGHITPALFNDKQKRGYIDSLRFRVNGQEIRWEYDKRHIDICKLYLKTPLLPGGKITISTPFYVKIPSAKFSRMGYDGQSYQITQWYPKPAVYDRYGWHEMPYLNMGEFYSEYGSFEVEITVPRNYVVAATGNLMNDEEAAFLQKKVRETEAIKDYNRHDNAFPPSDKTFKTLLYREKNIHDFAWFADKRFHVLQGEVELPHSHRKVTTWVYYPNRQAHLWKDAIAYVNDAVYYYSLWYGDYPYDNCSAVHAPLSAGGGMEYPTITVIANMRSAKGLDNVIAHEVGHNWFYGILGSNEREHPWMDEGINSFSDQRYTATKALLKKAAPDTKNVKINNRNQISVSSLNSVLSKLVSRTPFKQGLALASPDYSEMNYGLAVYQNTAQIFWYVFDYLGEDKFNDVIQTYYERWKYKHPYPEDIRRVFEEKTGENMDWLFEHLLKTNERMDYALEIEGDSLEIENKGDFAAPVKLQLTGDDSSQYRWIKNIEDEKTTALKSVRNYRRIRIDDDVVPDAFPRNDVLFPQQKIPSYKKIKLSLAHPVENAERTYLNFTPIAGKNQYDGMMLGLWFYKPFIPIPKLEVHWMPLYAFKTQRIVDTGHINYHYLTSGSRLQEIEFHTGTKRFSVSADGDYYQRYKTGINLYFSSGKSGDEEIFSAFWTHVRNPGCLQPLHLLQDYFTLRYSYDYFKKINPHSFQVQTEITSSYVKANVEASYKVHYQGKDGLNTHVFLGSYLAKSEDLTPYYDYSLSGGEGANDYLFDQWYMARYETDTSSLWSHQFIPSEGGFVAGGSLKSPWIGAVNFSLDVPSQLHIPLALYGNLAYGDFGGNNHFFYESGISLSVLRGAFEFYFPLHSSRLPDSGYGNIFREFRFVVNVNKLGFRELSKMVR